MSTYDYVSMYKYAVDFLLLNFNLLLPWLIFEKFEKIIEYLILFKIKKSYYRVKKLEMAENTN